MSMSSSSAPVRVVTYNVLSSELSEPESFPKNTAEECAASTRFPAILSKLATAAIADDAVVCLQEVSIQWVGKLHAFFQSHEYSFVHTLYGSKFNGYMGVGIAYPTSLYKLVDCDIVRLSDTKSCGWPKPPPPPAPPAAAEPSAENGTDGAVSRFLVAANPLNWFHPTAPAAPAAPAAPPARKKEKWGEEGEKKPPAQVWKDGERRWNQAVFVRLAPKTTRKGDQPAAAFCVATYHMPCTIHMKAMMTLHASLLMRWSQRLAGTDPLVLAGDFNSTPDSGSYEFFRRGTLEAGHEHYPTPPEWDAAYDPSEGVEGMDSAYALAHPEGKEPETTNKAFRCIWGNENEFSGCLDYVFLTPGRWAVETVTPLPTEAEVPWLPSLAVDQPSDHLLLGATLRPLPPPPPQLGAKRKAEGALATMEVEGVPAGEGEEGSGAKKAKESGEGEAEGAVATMEVEGAAAGEGEEGSGAKKAKESGEGEE